MLHMIVFWSLDMRVFFLSNLQKWLKETISEYLTLFPNIFNVQSSSRNILTFNKQEYKLYTKRK